MVSELLPFYVVVVIVVVIFIYFEAVLFYAERLDIGRTHEKQTNWKKKANGIKADVVPLHCKLTNVWVVYFTVVVIADKERVQNAMTSQYQNWWLIMFVWFIYYIDTQRDVNKTKEWKNRFAACQTGNSKLDRYTQSIQYTTFVLFEVNFMNRRLIDIRTCNTAYCFAFAVFRSTTELSYSISCTLSAV